MFTLLRCIIESTVCPEEPVDNRCLYDKLEEQRVAKQEEHDEKFAFSKLPSVVFDSMTQDTVCHS